MYEVNAEGVGKGVGGGLGKVWKSVVGCEVCGVNQGRYGQKFG